jgi:parallel beta-helix repeat protein
LIANRSNDPQYAGANIGVRYFNNILYRFNPATGAGISAPEDPGRFNQRRDDAPDVILGAGTDVTERGFINTNSQQGVAITSLAFPEATRTVGGATSPQINDGDRFTLVAVVNGQTVTRIFEFNSGPELILNFAPNAPVPRVLQDGDRFQIDGVTYEIETGSTPVPTPGVRTVFYNASMNNEQFARALRQAVPASIQVGFEGNRLNLSGATSGSFNELVARNVATVGVGNGGISGQVPINFLAQDTAETIAARVVQAIRGQLLPGISASQRGLGGSPGRSNEVELQGSASFSNVSASIDRLGSIASNGSLTGIAGINDTLYAVSNVGGLYRVGRGQLLSNFAGAIGSFVTTSYELRGIPFTGLVRGPVNVAGGVYANLLFGTTATGRIYAFDTNGYLQPVFANGATFVDTGIPGLDGVAFSNLDFNLWHATARRGDNPGHGVNADIEGNAAVAGGNSWYFGFEGPGAHSNADLSGARNPLAAARANGAPLLNSYNFPGGALGVLESQPISLASISPADMPTLYFNYFLSTESAASGNDPMSDSFRVYAAGDNGSWVQLATNNDSESTVERLVDNVTGPIANGTVPPPTVTNPAIAWRQARVSLSSLAGNREVRFRFEFSTAGGIGYNSFGGRGLEMRTIAGSQLRDGQIFTVNGQNFELEMGTTMIFPSGAGIRNLETLTVGELSFVFWNGTGTAPAGNVIRYSANDSPADVANAALAVINAATFPAQAINLSVSPEPATRNEIIATATPINNVPGVRTRVVANGAIGDITAGPNEDVETPRRDVDMLRVNLEAGSTLNIRVSASEVGSSVNPRIRLFDSVGNQIARTVQNLGLDVELTATISVAGEYYIGISNTEINNYNPNVEEGRASVGATGLYRMTMDITPRTSVSVVDNRLQLFGLGAGTLTAGSRIQSEGAPGLTQSGNVQVQILQTMTAAQVAVAVSQAIERSVSSSVDSFPTIATRGDFIDMTGYTVGSAGPFVVTGVRPGDDTSEYAYGARIPAFRARNNAFEGLYIDDFMIGLAERGEFVTGATPNTAFVQVPSAGSEILVGSYQLEVRTGSDYGTPTRDGIILNRAFDPNQALNSTVQIRFNDASKIADGSTITLNDGTNSITLEFDDVSLPVGTPGRGVRPGNVAISFNPIAGESAFIIAERFRNAINSSVVQSVLRIGALSSDGSSSGQNSTDVSLVGSINVDMSSDVGFIFNRSPNLRFKGSSQIQDGDTIQIEDGMSSITLEFDDSTAVEGSPSYGVRDGNVAIPFDPSVAETGTAVAARVLAIINSFAVQSRVRVIAYPVAGLGGQASDAITVSGAIGVFTSSNVGAVIPVKLFGDRNTPRDQGQIIVENSRIYNSSGFGISITAGARDAVSGAPNPGSVRNLLTINNQRLIPGAVVMNNELIGNIRGGINIEGDAITSADRPPAPVPFARIVNNTIVGGRVTNVPTPVSTTVDGMFYRAGDISFADSVVSYDPRSGGGPVPLAGLQDPTQAIGAPNYSSVGEPRPNQGVVSLGRGGVLVVRFDDNILTGSDDSSPDLAVYEVGGAELVRVEVSSDGVTYTSVGTASFNSPFIDLDRYGFSSLSQLYYVRLTDERDEGGISGDSVGADIDAVGAISSRGGYRFVQSGTGIRISNNASPTLLNNIVVNNLDGITLSPNSSSTVLGGTLYQYNTRNVSGAPLGQFPITVESGVPLFTRVEGRNLYPVPGAPSIDSSIDSLLDRSAMLSVKQPVGLAPSPILAPSRDVYGALRVDDPAVVAPPGLGESIFKERGAADRSDFVGPIAVSMNPRDNDATGLDGNPAPNVVELVSSSLQYFEIQLLDASDLNGVDQGSDIDPATVIASALSVSKNGKRLVEGRDYRFGYDATSNIIRLTAISGLWESGAVYTIRFVNSKEHVIRGIAPSLLQDGSTYTVLDSSKAPHYFEIETGIRLTVPASEDGLTHNIADGSIFRIDDGSRRVTFEFDSNDTATTGIPVIRFDRQDFPSVIAQKIVDVINAQGLNVTAKAFGNGEIQLLSLVPVEFIPENSGIASFGATGTTPIYGFQIRSIDGIPQGIFDGQTFAIQRGGLTATFEFDGNATVTPGNVRVGLDTASKSNQAALIAAAINASGLGVVATANNNGYVSVGSNPTVRVTAGTSALQVVGIPGRIGTTPIVIDLATIQTAQQVAEQIHNVLIAANLPGVSPQLIAAEIYMDGATGLTGLGVVDVLGIRDRAGNSMRSTELNGQSLINIFLGEGFDYGDAPDPFYSSLRDSNGPRHKVVNGFSLGATVTADPDARVIDEDLDDGVTFTTLVSGFTGSMQLTAQGITNSRPGFATAWIDFDGDGIFESSEKINIPGRIVNGTNTAIVFSVPGTAVIDRAVAARIRFSSNETAIASPTGDAPDGEVEDFLVTISRNPYTNPANRFDVTGDGFVSPIDVLQIVNYINTGLPPRPPVPPTSVPPYLDVDSDGFIGPLDVLAVINHINSNIGGRGGEGEGPSGLSDRWIAAAPTIKGASSASMDQDTRVTNESRTSRRSESSLDAFLASLASQEMGPISADDSIDAISLVPPPSSYDREDSERVDALDEILQELM